VTLRETILHGTIDRLADWLVDPLEALFPYDSVLAAYHNKGKHFVAYDLLAALADVRKSIGRVAGSPARIDMLRCFLNIALDKFDNTYDYPSYVALRMLPLPTIDEPSEFSEIVLPRRDRLSVQLLADTLGFELLALEGRTKLFPLMRPSAATVAKRCRLGMRVAAPALHRIGLPAVVHADDSLAQAAQLHSTMRNRMDAIEHDMLRFSIMPVYVLHDEYLFIRVLQLFETCFAALAVSIRSAIELLTENQIKAAVERLSEAGAVLRESLPLFSLLATMEVEAFRTFREYTEGASAIQSRNYKLVESLCRKPDEDRLDSVAYYSVPEVRQRVLAGQFTIDEAYRHAMADASDAGGAELTAAMTTFSGSLLRWRQTHYRLAVRMLGQRTGTGYTEGTPYLDSVRRIPVFRSVLGTHSTEQEKQA